MPDEFVPPPQRTSPGWLVGLLAILLFLLCAGGGGMLVVVRYYYAAIAAEQELLEARERAEHALHIAAEAEAVSREAAERRRQAATGQAAPE